MGNVQVSHAKDPNFFSKKRMIRIRRECAFHHYDIHSIIGEGSHGFIYKVIKKETKATLRIGATEDLSNFFGVSNDENNDTMNNRLSDKHSVYYALKNIKQVDQKFIRDAQYEIHKWRRLDHPNIIKAYDMFEAKHTLCITMELCTGGNLYRRMPYSEMEACVIVRQLVSAVSYMHKKGILHQEITFDNILFESDHPDAEIKLMVFGKFEDISGDFEGTVFHNYKMKTANEEIINTESSYHSDMWYVGVVAYELLLSNFVASRRKSMEQEIEQRNYNFRHKCWRRVSADAKHFVSSLLQLNVSKDIDADQAISIPCSWLDRGYQVSRKQTQFIRMNDLYRRFVKYASTSAFTKLLLFVIAYTSPVHDIISVRQIFRDLDLSNNGFLSFVQFRQFFISHAGSEDELVAIFHSMSAHEDGIIHYTEFLAATIELGSNIGQDELEEAFDFLDVDHSGFISKKNLKDFLGQVPENYVDELISEVDRNKDGLICYNDLQELFHEVKREVPLSFDM